MSEQEKTTQTVTAETLPLPVREFLMRGLQNKAVENLVEEHHLSEAEAIQLIEDYRAALRERKLQLDIQMMSESNHRDNYERYSMIAKSISWGILIVSLIAMSYLFLYKVK